MITAELAFHTPTRVEQALELLAASAMDGGKVLGGGMSLVPAMNLGLARPSALVSLNHISELEGVHDTGDAIRIGAVTRHAQIVSDPLIREHAPLLATAASVIGDMQIRHRGTIGGSVVHADPAADYLPVLVALDASMTLASVAGERQVPAREFFVDVLRTALQPDEILVAVEFRKLASGTGSAYLRLARLEGSFPIVNAAALADGGTPVVAIGGATATPVLVAVPDGGGPEEIRAAAEAACSDAFGDLSATADYRRAMAGVFAARAVQAAGGARSA